MGPTGASTSVFKVGNRVFAKVMGHPYWPAQVTEVRKEEQTVEYCVAFYGSQEIAYVKPPLVCEYSEENIKKFDAIQKKSKKKSLVLSYQRAMEECASGVTLVPCDVDEEEASINEGVKVADLSRSMTSDEETLHIDLHPPRPPTPVPAVPKTPKRGRPSKKETLQNNQASTRKSLRVKTAPKTLSMATVDVVDSKPVATPRDEEEMTEDQGDPLKLDAVSDADTQIIENAEGVSENVATSAENSSGLEEGVGLKSTPVIPAADTSITSRSGRKIKPKKFADEVISPMSDHLMAALKSSQASPAKKRKVSQDESTEDESSETVQNGVNNGHAVPKKTKKSLSAEDFIPNEEKPLASLPGKRRSGKSRSLSDDSSSGTASTLAANISWKVEAMKLPEDKLISSCKLIENLRHEDENSNEDLPNAPSPEQDKDAKVSAPRTNVETLPFQSSKPTTPFITKSNGTIGALAKVVAGESSRKASSNKSTSLRNVSVGTSTAELLRATEITNPVILKPEPQVDVPDKSVVAPMTNGDSNVIVSNIVKTTTIPEKASEGKSIIKVQQAMDKAVAVATATRRPVNQNVKIDFIDEEAKMNQQVTSTESAAANEKDKGVAGVIEPRELEVIEPRVLEVIEPRVLEVIEPRELQVIQPPASETIQPQTSEDIKPQASEAIQPEQGSTEMKTASKSSEDSGHKEAPATPKEGPGTGPASKTPLTLKKKVVFSEDTNSHDPPQNNEVPGTPSEGTSKTPVAAKKSRGGILRKTLIEAEEIKVEEVTPARRPQRIKEAPSRFKDSIPLPLIATPRSFAAAARAIAIQNGRKSESPRAKRPRTDETEEMNGSRTSEETDEDDEDIEHGDFKLELTEEDFQDEESKQKFKSKLREKTVMDTLVQITDAVMDTHHDVNQAIELLVKFQQPGFVDKAILKKFPEIVQVVRKLQYFVGNPKAKMSKFQRAELPSKTEKIRDQAEKTLESFKEIMSTNEKPLAVLMMEEMQRKSIEGSE